MLLLWCTPSSVFCGFFLFVCVFFLLFISLTGCGTAVANRVSVTILYKARSLMGLLPECLFQAIFPEFSSWFSCCIFSCYCGLFLVHLAPFVCNFIKNFPRVSSIFCLLPFRGSSFVDLPCFVCSVSFILIYLVTFGLQFQCFFDCIIFCSLGGSSIFCLSFQPHPVQRYFLRSYL